MTQPKNTRNLDSYGHDALEWSRARERLAADSPTPDVTFFLATVRPDGRPHSTGVGALWVDDTLYVVSGPDTRKSRNLAANPSCSVAVRLKGLDLTLEGEAHRITDQSTLEQVAHAYRDSGWPAEAVEGAVTAPFSAPSAGPGPWWVYRLTVHTAFAVATEEPHGATAWDFS